MASGVSRTSRPDLLAGLADDLDALERALDSAERAAEKRVRGFSVTERARLADVLDLDGPTRELLTGIPKGTE